MEKGPLNALVRRSWECLKIPFRIPVHLKIPAVIGFVFAHIFRKFKPQYLYLTVLSNQGVFLCFWLGLGSALEADSSFQASPGEHTRGAGSVKAVTKKSRDFVI